MLGWGRVVRANEDFDLREHFLGGLLIGAHEVEGTGSLTVKSHSLSEGLSDHHLEALVDEEAEAISILVEGSGGEALVGSVEEGVESVLAADISNSVPLLLSWVNTSWVVSAGVEKHDGAWLGILEVLNHTFNIETSGLLVEVAVLSDREASGSEDGVMVAPGWVADIESAWLEFLEEVRDDAEGASSGKSLHGGNTSTVDVSVLPAEQNLAGTSVELLESVNWKILLVQFVIGDDLSLDLAHNWENEWLSVVVAVGTNT